MKVLSHLDWYKPERAFPCYYVLPAIIGAIGVGAAALGSSLSNKHSSDKANETNQKNVENTNKTNLQIAENNNKLALDMFNQQMDYTKAVQQAEWNRADNAIQRQTADALNSGISPLAVAGSGGASSGSIVSQPSAPNLHSAEMVAAQQNPFLTDVNTAADLYRSLTDVVMKDKSLSSTEKENALNRQASMEELTKSLDAAAENLSATLNAESSEKTKDRVLQQTIAFNQLKEVIRSNKASERIAANEQIEKAIYNLTGGFSMPKDYYTDYDKYQAAMEAFIPEFCAINLRFSTGDPSKSSQSSGKTTSVGANGSIANIVGAGANTTLSETSSSSTDYTMQDNAALRAEYGKLKYPVFVGDYK